MLLALAVAVSIGLVVLPARTAVAGGALILAAAVHPLLGVVAIACVVAVLQLGRIRVSRSDTRDVESESVLALELVGLGVTAGLPFRNAAAVTADQIRGPVGQEIEGALRSMSAGHTPNIATAAIRSIFSAAESSERAGIPLAGQLNAAATDRRRAAAAETRERLAKLPVKMLFPLAFLILPGFVLLAVVPPLISGLSRLGL